VGRAFAQSLACALLSRLLSVAEDAVRLTDYGIFGARILIAFALSLVLDGRVFSEDKRASREVEKIAEKVRQKAESSEKAEGSQDLVKDEVTAKKDDTGKPVSSNAVKPHFMAQAFTERRLPRGKDSTRMI
jgi:hypothetical protein